MEKKFEQKYLVPEEAELEDKFWTIKDAPKFQYQPLDHGKLARIIAR